MNTQQPNEEYTKFMNWFKATHPVIFENFNSNINFEEGKFYVSNKNGLNEED